MTAKAKRAHWIALGLFVLPNALVFMTLNSFFKIGGVDPTVEAIFIYLLLWPLQIPLIVMLVYDVRDWLRRRSS